MIWSAAVGSVHHDGGGGILRGLAVWPFGIERPLMLTNRIDRPQSAVAIERVSSDRAAAEFIQPTELIRISVGAATGVGIAALGTEMLRHIVSAPDALMQSARKWLKNDRDRRVALIQSPGRGAFGPLCYKEMSSRRWVVRIVSRFAKVRAWNAFHKGLLLRRLQIATPQPLLVVSARRPGVYQEYLLTAAVPGAVSLQDWLGSQPSRKSAKARFLKRQSLAQHLGNLLQRLHAERFDHRDLKPTNLLLSTTGQVWLIDLDGVWRWPILPRFRRTQNLARLWAGLSAKGLASATDALRFLRAYLPARDYQNWKTVWRQVARRAERKIRQKQ